MYRKNLSGGKNSWRKKIILINCLRTLSEICSDIWREVLGKFFRSEYTWPWKRLRETHFIYGWNFVEPFSVINWKIFRFSAKVFQRAVKTALFMFRATPQGKDCIREKMFFFCFQTPRELFGVLVEQIPAGFLKALLMCPDELFHCKGFCQKVLLI